jgi:cytoskeletal protein CcmA (bactofilin family)
MALQSPFFNHRREPSADPGLVRRSAAGSGALGRHTHAGATTLPTLQESESRLIVGPHIKLKSVEITDCDTLLVDGAVEATMNLRLMQVNERGSYTGTAEVDTAEIRGQFDGVLMVRETLVIHATGRVAGRIRYGRIVIEEGGQLAGDIETGAVQPAPATPVLQAVAAG